MQDYGNALNAALEKAAPDGGSYLSGQLEFHQVLMRTKDVDVALDAAMKKAAPDGGSYLSGRNTFWEVQKATLRGRFTTWLDRGKHKVGLNGATIIH